MISADFTVLLYMYYIILIILLSVSTCFSQLNVKDYRAKGDGLLDDQSYIQSAINSLRPKGGEVYIFQREFTY